MRPPAASNVHANVLRPPEAYCKLVSLFERIHSVELPNLPSTRH
ncbi:MAG: hypothetical protein ACTS46_01580 [Candidatus Hodgkinia cicadicola]